MLRSWTGHSTHFALASRTIVNSISRLHLLMSLLENLLQTANKLLDSKVNEYFPKTFLALGVLLNKIDAYVANSPATRPSNRPSTPNRTNSIEGERPNQSVSGLSRKSSARTTQIAVGLNFKKEDAILSSVLGAKKRESVSAILKTAPEEGSQKRSDDITSLKGRNIRPIILPVEVYQ